ncbi:phenol hydroxylase [Haloferax sp. ATCC BAA-646]|nr:phenol hydroxylase [Haloferax sp. ATCC BAA-646]
MVALEGRGHLLELAVVHDGDTVGHRHRLRLVVGDVDGRDRELVLQVLEFGPHLRPQFSVQVGQRFVHQEHLGVAHDSTSEGDPLLLAAREFVGFAVEQVADAERLRDLDDALVAFFRRVSLLFFQPEPDVLPDGHVGVQRVVLKHHRDVAVLRDAVVHVVPADVDVPAGRGLQAGEHPERRRFAAARGTDEHEELLVVDVEREVVDGDRVAEALRQAGELNLSHGSGLRAKSLRELFGERDVQDERRNRREERRGHPDTEVDAGGRRPDCGQHQRDRCRGRVGPGDEREREEELVVNLRELVDEHDAEHRLRDGQDDAPVNLRDARAVDFPGLHERVREALVVRPEQYRTDGNPVGDVGDDERHEVGVVALEEGYRRHHRL